MVATEVKIPAFSIESSMVPETIDPPETQLRQRMNEEGISPPPILYLDGNWNRFSTNGKKNDKAGWYIVNDGEILSGAFGDWRSRKTCYWRADIGRTLTLSEEIAHRASIDTIKDRYEKEKNQKQEAAAKAAASIWKNTAEAPADHPYLVKKGVKPHGVHITRDRKLIIPVYDMEKLTSLQYISETGDKIFLTGGAIKGLFWALGELDSNDRIFITEGFATAASIYEAVGNTVFITHGINNLKNITRMLREMRPEAKLTIVADNEKSGIGERSAKEAALGCQAEVVIPPDFGDANDYQQAGGNLRTLLLGPKQTERYFVCGNDFLTSPKPVSWLIKHWVQANSMAMIHRPSGSGKTFVVLDWMLHLATGKPSWHDMKVTPCYVAYLCGEGFHGMYSRIAAWATEHQETNLEHIHVSRDSSDLVDLLQLQKVIEEIHLTGLQPKIIAVDTLNCFFSKDENSAQDTREFLSSCKMLQKEFGCTILIVHHTGVNPEAQNRARGSSAWKGPMDIEIGVKPLDKNGVILGQLKVKDGERLDPLSLELKPVAIPGWYDEDGEQISSVVIVNGGVLETKTTPSLNQKIDDLCTAWRKVGVVLDGEPFLERELWKYYLTDIEHKTQSNVNKMLGSTDKNRLVGALIANKIIQEEGSGYRIIDPILAAKLLLERGYNQ